MNTCPGIRAQLKICATSSLQLMDTYAFDSRALEQSQLCARRCPDCHRLDKTPYQPASRNQHSVMRWPVVEPQEVECTSKQENPQQ